MTKRTTTESSPVIHWVIVFVYGALVWFVSDHGLPKVPTLYYRFQLDKMIHFMEFGFFAVLLCRAVRRTVALTIRKVMLIGFLIVAGYAMSDEIHQAFVVGRTSDWKDFCSDLTGSLFGVFVWRARTALRWEANWVKKAG